ncbi:hypothetical protein IPM19_00430 [bacterium]|nr:MAG: hypothetical protein IPM19_00430 [bacterium]
MSNQNNKISSLSQCVQVMFREYPDSDPNTTICEVATDKYLINFRDVNDSEIIISRWDAKDTAKPWEIYYQDLRDIFAQFTAPALRGVSLNTFKRGGMVHSFTFKLASGQIFFNSGHLTLRSVKNQDDLIAEIKKFDKLFKV